MIPTLTIYGDFSAWRRQVEAFYALKKIVDDAEKLAVLPAMVSSDLLRLGQWDSHATIKSALETIKKVYMKLNMPDNSIKAFKLLTYSSNLRELCLDVQKFGDYINASEEVLIRKFISLLPYSLQMAAHLHAPDLSKAKLRELADYLSVLPMPEVSSSYVGATTAGRPTNTVTCYNCDRRGHYSRECRQPSARCGRCGRRQLQKFCRSNGPINAVVGGSHTKDGNFTVDITVDGKPLKALVDTGSPKSFVDSSVRGQCLEFESCHNSYRNVNGVKFDVKESAVLNF